MNPIAIVHQAPPAVAVVAIATMAHAGLLAGPAAGGFILAIVLGAIYRPAPAPPPPPGDEASAPPRPPMPPMLPLLAVMLAVVACLL